MVWWGRVTEDGSLRSAEALSDIRALSVRLEKLERMRSGAGPQLTPAQIRTIIEEALWAERVMQALSPLNFDESAAVDCLRVNRLATQAREGMQAVPLSEQEGRAFEEKLLERRSDSTLCPGNRKELTPDDRIKMQYVSSTYPDSVRYLLQNGRSCTQFFQWALRSGAPVDLFVQFPKLSQELMKCHADKRFGAVFGYTPHDSGLRIQDGRVEMKVYGGIAGNGIPSGSSYVSIHERALPLALRNRNCDLPQDPSSLVHRSAAPYIVTVGEIFRQLKEKTTQYGRIEVAADGVCNWDAIRQGSYDSETGKIVRIPSLFWKEGIPPVAVHLTLEQIQERFPGQKIEGKGVKFSLNASRLYEETEFGERGDKTHAYLSLFLPDGTGRFNEMCFGLQPYVLPKNDFHRFWLIGGTELADVHVIDESRYLSQREHKGLLFNLTGAEEELLNRFLIDEMDKGRKGHKIFQPQGNNCANWIQKAFWKLFVDILLFDSLEEIAAQDNLPSYVRSYVRSLERATKASNDVALQRSTARLLGHLNRSQMIRIVFACHNLLEKTFYKDRPQELPSFEESKLQQADLERLRRASGNLLMQTLKTTQFFRMRILDADSSVGFVNFLNRFFKFLIRENALSEFLINRIYQLFNFLLFFSWRFSLFYTEKGVRLKALFTNKYHQAGTVALPAGLWQWEKRNAWMLKELHRCFADFQHLQPFESC